MTKKELMNYVVSQVNNCLKANADIYGCDDMGYGMDILDIMNISWCDNNYDTIYIQYKDDLDELAYSPQELKDLIDKYGVEHVTLRILF